jgi:ribosome-interacting GTPase 1
MPANLPPDYFAAEKRFREAKSIDEKIAILEEMMAIMPKHKGTDKLFGDLKRKMAKLKSAKESQGKSGRKEHWKVEREGAGQIVLIGPPNSGKSMLLRALTKAEPEVADYPFTTTSPVPGMMPFENIKIQLVEAPAITSEIIESWIPNLVSMADAVMLITDLSSDNIVEDAQAVLEQLESRKIILSGSETEEVKPPYRRFRTAIVANKLDAEDAAIRLDLLKEAFGARFNIIPVSAKEKDSCKSIPPEAFRLLKIIRVYPKKPGKKLEMDDPLILKEGATVLEAAEALHKEIAQNLRYARGWGEGIYDGQHLARDFVLKDGFILEFH